MKYLVDTQNRNHSYSSPVRDLAEYETGEVKRLDIAEYIHRLPELRPLAEHPERFYMAKTTIDDSHIGWKIGENTYVTYHSDHIYRRGEDMTNMWNKS